ncbi:Bug family tripartite tricarboxylate transporter substrate binding protein [Faunimonas sp. B44]|uniref:Bug family tripartite tricarboxylate transporter substrate binding protein n=1 Tax=Faunimonas sp. B44 TaxID=3461493 RepID=UPI0040449239
MREGRLISWRLVLGFAAGLAMAGPVQAQTDYPKRSVNVVVPTGPGGATDTTARSVAETLSKVLGQTFVVENQPGAQGLVAMSSFTDATPDGYTLLLMASSQSVLPAFYELPYDPIEDITPIARLTIAPVLLMVNKDFPAGTVEEFVTYAKAHPDEITYGYQGGPPQLAAATFASVAGFEALGVPFNASAQAMTELIAGRVTYLMMTAEQAKAQVDGGTLKALGTAGSQRAKTFPDVPTLEELGYPTYGTGWFGLVGPKGLPQEIVDKLWTTLQETYIGKEPQQALAAKGLEPANDGPDSFRAIIADEIERWQAIAGKLGIEKKKP